MKKLMQTARKFWADENGLETVEYAVMTALIVAALVTAVTLLSAAISGRFGEVTTTVGTIN